MTGCRAALFGASLLTAATVMVACESYPGVFSQAPVTDQGPTGSSLQAPAAPGMVRSSNGRVLRPLSGPLTLNLQNLEAMLGGRTVQAGSMGFTNTNQGVGARQVEVRVYDANPNFPLASNAMVSLFDVTNGMALAATKSLSNGNLTSLNMIAVPEGLSLVRVNVYDDNANHYETDTGNTLPSASGHLYAQGEATVSAKAGLPANMSVLLYRCLPKTGLIHSGSSTPSVSFAGPGPGGFLRMPDWNPYTELTRDADNGFSGNFGKIRLTIVNPVAWASNFASSSNVVGWNVGSIASAQGVSATHSYSIPDGATSRAPWLFADATRKVIYTDIDLVGGEPDFWDLYTHPSQTDMGGVSFSLPAGVLPSAYTLFITDLGAAASLKSVIIAN